MGQRKEKGLHNARGTGLSEPILRQAPSRGYLEQVSEPTLGQPSADVCRQGEHPLADLIAQFQQIQQLGHPRTAHAQTSSQVRPAANHAGIQHVLQALGELQDVGAWKLIRSGLMV